MIRSLIRKTRWTGILSAFLLLAVTSCAPHKVLGRNEIFMFVGSYSSKGAPGIETYALNEETAQIRPLNSTNSPDASYLSLTKNGRHLYAVSERETQNESSVRAFSFNKRAGILTLINTQPAGGGAPAHIVISPDGKHVITANYFGGSFSEYNVLPDGGIKYETTVSFHGKGFDPERQEQSHIHYGIFSPNHRSFFVTDLGLDKIYKYDFFRNQKQFLRPATPPSYSIKPGSGPRHMVFSKNGKYLYLITEISGDVDVFDAKNFSEIQTIKSDSVNGRGSAAIKLSPDGRFLYTSNRLKDDGIAIFSVNRSTGKLSRIGYQTTGIHPRDFAITPNGKYLVVAARDSDELQVFQINENGLLTDTDRNIQISMPVVVKFLK